MTLLLGGKVTDGDVSARLQDWGPAVLLDGNAVTLCADRHEWLSMPGSEPFSGQLTTGAAVAAYLYEVCPQRAARLHEVSSYFDYRLKLHQWLDEVRTLRFTLGPKPVPPP